MAVERALVDAGPLVALLKAAKISGQFFGQG
jgi:hypothetical protein